VILVSDNGASGDGGPDGSVNDMLFANGVPDRLSHKRVFLGEGIMIELNLRPWQRSSPGQALAAAGSGCDMVADNVVLLQTPAVAEPTEVGLS